ncbi:hypothetical protein [Streptomyces sp. TRM68367]|uniref:hypothetical protein n=1 Tax=Streptomyces sp. TRM68367 TaxID=2758415 RepID=UPI00165B7EEA|nr:hypothetical protein [Streptomyces sp. TRM68367]MBC9729222.1 hypothetical protein [Streptomyces sp. TRM68367]
MDLTAALLRVAAARPRVLLVPMPGGTGVRLAAERELRRRDLPPALTPAQADILLVTGPDCTGLSAPVDRLWEDMPAPRVRAHAQTAEEAAAVIETARSRLAVRTARPPADTGHNTGGSGDGSADHHAGHGGGQSDMPAGLPLAGRGPDRDGLTLDQLHVPLGPLLADWPTGLTLRLTLQGDVVQEAAVEVTRAGASASATRFWTEPWQRAVAGEAVQVGAAVRRRAAARLDSLGRLLAVAGWPATATASRRLRDDLLDGAAGPGLHRRARRLARQVGRSRTLYWLTRGIGQLSATDARAAGVRGPAARADGDVPVRYRQWLTTVTEDVARLDEVALLDPDREEGPHGRWDATRPSSAGLVQLLPGLLEGAELAAARLIVASLDPDPDELAAGLLEVTGGG